MRALDPPPAASTDPKATEMLRLWIANGKLDVVINIGEYQEQGHDEAEAWGIIISDFARHVARALAQRYGKNEEQEMSKIRDSFLDELDDPTSRSRESDHIDSLPTCTSDSCISCLSWASLFSGSPLRLQLAAGMVVLEAGHHDKRCH